MKLSRYCLASDELRDDLDGTEKRVVFSTRTGQLRCVGSELWRRVEQARFEEVPEEVLEDLIDAEFLVPPAENELESMLGRNRSAARDDPTAHVVVQPTAACQLGCDYCGQSHRAKKLSPEHRQMLREKVRATLAAKRYESLEITWFGAEALLALDVMRDLTRGFRELAAQFSADYRAVLISNGLALSPPVATELVRDLGVKAIELTLDGDAEHHDQRRAGKDGSPTFERIFANLVALAGRPELDVLLSIRCNVDSRNQAGVAPLLQRLAAAGLQRRIANFYVQPVYSWGNEADRQALALESFARREIEWFVEMVRLGFRPQLIPPRKPITCMAVRPGAFLVDPSGNLFDCAEASLVPSYEARRGGFRGVGAAPANQAPAPEPEENLYSIGHLATGEKPGRRDRLGGFHEAVRGGAYECHECAMLPVCGGACPKQWLEGTPPCPSARLNIKERLALSYAVHRLEPGGPSPTAELDPTCRA